MSAQAASALAQALVQFLWQGAVAAGLLAAAIYLFRPSSARVRYALACVAMAAMLASFGATLASHWPHAASATIRSTGARYAVPVPPLFQGYEDRMLNSYPKPVQWIAPLWLLGVLILSLRSIAGWIAVARLKRSGVVAAAEIWQRKLAELSAMLRVSRLAVLLESYVAEAPVVIGFLKPVILIPAQLFTGFSSEQIECILIHELAHIRRHDYLVNLLQTFAENLLFYHPAVWWVSSVIRAERENCCDDVVAGLSSARTFAEALVELEQRRWAAQETAMAANGGHLMNRVQRLLNINTRPRLASPGFFASLLPLTFAIATSIARAQTAVVTPPIPAPIPPRPPELIALAKAAPARPSGVLPQVQQANPQQTPYKRWLNEEVFWIIYPEERAAFNRLTTNDEREAFIEDFWFQRDPTPGTEENEYREEHYRRVAYADETFGTPNIPGWKTDRGMIYIRYGPPNERDQHPTGGTYERPLQEGGGQTTTFPFEVWHYATLPGVGNNVQIEFVDAAGNGEYRMTADPSEKDAVASVPGAGLTMYEQLGLANKSDRFSRTDGTRLGTGTAPLPASMNQFDRLQLFAQLQRPPRPNVPAEDAVETIVFRGLHRIPDELARNAIRTQTGDRYDKEALDRDIQALQKSQAFDGVAWSAQRGQTGWVVTFTVAERP